MMTNVPLRKAHLWSSPIMNARKLRLEEEKRKEAERIYKESLYRGALFEEIFSVCCRLRFRRKMVGLDRRWQEDYQQLRKSILYFLQRYGEFNTQELVCLKNHLINRRAT